MSTKRMDLKKQQKKTAIEDAAFALFCEKGIKKTSIDEIVDRSDVAKGTFYLYFKNKQALVDELVLREAINVIQEAAKELADVKNAAKPFEDKIIVVIDYILSYFKKSPAFLKFIHKDLYRGVLREENRHYIIKAITQKAKLDFDIHLEHFEKKLYLIFELVGSVMYNAILFNEPYEMDEIQPMLYRVVKDIVRMPLA